MDAMTSNSPKELFRWLAGESTPNHLAGGATLGLALGLLPKDTLLAYLLLVAAILFAANIFWTMASTLLFTAVGWIGESLLHKLGAIVLSNEVLLRVWAALYHMPVLPWTRFNNSVVMGGIVASLVLAYPVYRLSRSLLPKILSPGPSLAAPSFDGPPTF
jgi:uncharacterized protein (TIGR03546 family)